VLHVLPISVFLTWSPKWNLVRSAEHKAPCYYNNEIALSVRQYKYNTSRTAYRLFEVILPVWRRSAKLCFLFWFKSGKNDTNLTLTNSCIYFCCRFHRMYLSGGGGGGGGLKIK
jgi:hypothetical protein